MDSEYEEDSDEDNVDAVSIHRTNVAMTIPGRR